MNKFDISKIIKSVQMFTSKRSPEILTGIGIAGMVTTTILAVRATPKALYLIDEEYVNHPRTDDSDLSTKEIIKVTWKCYAPVAILGCTSIACLIGATSVNLRRNAAIATAYTLSETALREYQEKVIETIGEKKEQVVRDVIAQDKINKNPVSDKEIIITEKGNTLCYDSVSGRYFKSDIDLLKRAENEINKRLRTEMYISLNDFYYEIGLNRCTTGDLLGWSIESCEMDIRFSSNIADDGTPCLVVSYEVKPRFDC